MVQVGVKTAAMPIGFVDAAIVLVNANLLVGDLCTIYNLRTSGLSTAAVLAWAFFNTVAASRLGEFTDEAAESVMKDVEAGLAGAVGGKVLAKASEGTLNALLVGRLGRTAMRRLRPVVLKR